MTLRDELMAIYQQKGSLTPELVVDTARDPGHPLHDKFEWDNDLAGEAYRLGQARTLIRTVKIRYVSDTTDTGSPPVRAFASVKTPNGRVYEPMEEVVADPFKAQLVLNDMKREWQAMMNRYRGFNEFWELVKADLPKEFQDGSAAA
jgi:hypothetical protein